MISATWSPDLSTTIASLKKLDVSERLSALKGLTGVSDHEKQTIMKTFTNSRKNEPKEDFWF
ncbi:hypothetical protein GQF01_07920 [Paenibacillus sp. 5J-6]|jgi:hypothetical protein|uniref:Uncharacterized protein n=1 Tax=Paenibacillus silvestris TaxID=2606219 RepID=A0A6L8UV05_9BACL|nr:hypothetical protein [Paenibacillus silvestris]MZQ82063.1 hypothetical protein [Paenibacillus silvestris]